MPGNQAVPHPDRPFSPSPPRENRHSASRPPSLLFGAPPIGTVASSGSFNISGLPSTPRSNLPRSSSNEDVRYFKAVDYGFASHTRHESEPQAAYTTPATHEPCRRTKGDYDLGHIRSDSESSTTSSASPPLGATPILSAISPSTPPRGQDISAETPTRYGSHTRSPSTNVNTKTFPEIPASPKSFNSGFSSSSSSYGKMSSSRSFPRLHQPTVIRRASGRGLAFLPPPAHAVSHSSNIYHQQQSPMATTRNDRHTSSIASLEHIQYQADMLDLGRPIARASEDNQYDKLISIKSSDDGHIVRPDSYSDIPLPSSRENDEALNEVQLAFTTDHSTSIGANTYDPESFNTTSQAISDYLPDPISHGLFEVDEESSGSDLSPAKAQNTDIEERPSRVDESLVPTPNIAERMAQTSLIRSDVMSTAEHPDTSLLADKLSAQDQGPVTTEENDELHDVMSSTEPADTINSSPSSDTVKPHIPHKIDTEQAAHLSYKARPGSTTYGINTPSAVNESRQITLYANFDRSYPSSSPIPQLTAYRAELALSWGNAKILRWVPGRKYVPDWNLKLVAGSLNDPVVMDIRAIIKAVVTKIPFLWRFASWL
ncbi:uncharacterized protein L201_002476 [Kwoniella dendrophila CBS 6074]|uniref:Uncharacterized protein n=1 Tax=Kwoniella dendrophila CBS 6074 TaxID=1295534 RepID=A0AAX4JQA3_9TREE